MISAYPDPQKVPMTRNLATILLVPLFTSSALFAQQEARQASANALRAVLSRPSQPAAKARANIVTACESQISCGQTVVAALTEDCQFQDGTAIDLFQFSGTQGQTVTVTATSADFPPFFDIEQPGTSASAAIGEGTLTTPATATAVLDTSGTWSIGVTSFTPDFVAGRYTLKLTCTDGPPNPSCMEDANTLCLNAGRFKVTATYDGGNAGAGHAQVVPLTDDTGYLWFFDASNVEAVVKVLNGCDDDGYYWVFAGGLTDVKVVLNVTDTFTGAVRRYVNPQDTSFKPIQDTGAFPACP
jgi:hypothetical protein